MCALSSFRVHDESSHHQTIPHPHHKIPDSQHLLSLQHPPLFPVHCRIVTIRHTFSRTETKKNTSPFPPLPPAPFHATAPLHASSPHNPPHAFLSPSPTFTHTHPARPAFLFTSSPPYSDSNQGGQMPRAEPTERLRKLEESHARIAAEIQLVKGRAAQQARKRDTHRKILDRGR